MGAWGANCDCDCECELTMPLPVVDMGTDAREGARSVVRGRGSLELLMAAVAASMTSAKEGMFGRDDRPT
jgi:hypothetical protein